MIYPLSEARFATLQTHFYEQGYGDGIRWTNDQETLPATGPKEEVVHAAALASAYQRCVDDQFAYDLGFIHGYRVAAHDRSAQ